MTSKNPPNIKYFWVPENRRIKMNDEPKAVQTVLPSSGGLQEDVEPDVGTPIHNSSVFFEDKIHDWNWRNGMFSYYSRVWTSGIWIRVEF